jgi:hypothetical protein
MVSTSRIIFITFSLRTKVWQDFHPCAAAAGFASITANSGVPVGLSFIAVV